MSSEVFNPNPTIFAPAKSKKTTHAYAKPHSLWLDDGEHTEDEEYDQSDEPEDIDQEEIFELIRSISDPEHRSMTLEQLAVVSAPQITFDSKHPDRLTVEFTPTVPHCGMSTFIGLSIRVRLLRSLPQRFKVDIRVKPGSHQSEHALNKQLNDKERVAAALENPALLEVLEQCLSSAGDHQHEH
ncbi:FAM96B protein [Cubamyces lactineus]|nr:FAM96B protein [Cubamyces lactineus]